MPAWLKLFEANMPYVSAAVCALIVLLIPRLSIGVIIAAVSIWANWPLSALYSDFVHS